MTNYKDYLNEQLQDDDFKKEWDAIEPEFAIIQAMIDAKKRQVMRNVCVGRNIQI